MGLQCGTVFMLQAGKAHSIQSRWHWLLCKILTSRLQSVLFFVGLQTRELYGFISLTCTVHMTGRSLWTYAQWRFTFKSKICFSELKSGIEWYIFKALYRFSAARLTLNSIGHMFHWLAGCRREFHDRT